MIGWTRLSHSFSHKVTFGCITDTLGINFPLWNGPDSSVEEREEVKNLILSFCTRFDLCLLLLKKYKISGETSQFYFAWFLCCRERSKSSISDIFPESHTGRESTLFPLCVNFELSSLSQVVNDGLIDYRKLSTLFQKVFLLSLFFVQKITQELAVVELPGDHFTILNPPFPPNLLTALTQ